MSNLSTIDTLISEYDQQIQQEELAKEKAKEEALKEAMAQAKKEIPEILEHFGGGELWKELQPYATPQVKWRDDNTAFAYFLIRPDEIRLKDIQIWVDNYETKTLGAIYSGDCTRYLKTSLNLSGFLHDCQAKYEDDRRIANEKLIVTLSDKFRYPGSYAPPMTPEEAKQVVAELCILAPDRASLWDEYLHKWINEWQIELLRQDAEERRKAEYGQIMAKFEDDYRAWFVKYLDSKKANIEKAEEFQKTYLDQLGKTTNYLLKYGFPYDGTMDISTVQVLEELPGGYYKVVDNGQIKKMLYYWPINMQAIELTPEDRSWWRSYEYTFRYDHYGPCYQVEFFYRPEVNIQTVLKSIQFADPGKPPEHPEELQEKDYRHIIDNITAENGE